MKQTLYTKEQHWLDKWDVFVQSNSNGSYLQFSDWAKSYTSYGFDFELCLLLNNKTIIGGYCAVFAKVTFFKFYILPVGPLFSENQPELLNELVALVPKRAAEIKACYCQIAIPNLGFELPALKIYNSGQLFKYIYSPNGLNWVDLKKYSDSEILLLDFKSSVRRDIRSSNRKGLSVAFLSDKEEIAKAYQLVMDNASERNYAIRNWNEINTTVLSLIEKKSAQFIGAYKNSELKGAIFIVKSGNYYTYVFGGTKKENPDLLVGHFLQWEALKLSISEQCVGYNISLGGSSGVVAFKNNFNAQEIPFENSKFYKVINSFLFAFFLYFEKYMKPYKKRIARVLSVFKK